MNKIINIFKFLYKLSSDMISRYFEHNVATSAAALTYYLIFSFFPFIIFLSSILGTLSLELPINLLDNVIPRDILGIFEGYLDYVSTNTSTQLLVFGFVFSIYFPMRAVHSLVDFVALAYDKEQKIPPVKRTLLDFAFTLGLITIIVLAIIFVIVGPAFLSMLDSLFPISIAQINLWSVLRFVLLAIPMTFILSAIYYFTPNMRITIKSVLPGAIGALFFWLLYSIGFSFYVENMANYSGFYGSIGAIIVLLIWLYFTSVTLILGAELNACIIKNTTGRDDNA